MHARTRYLFAPALAASLTLGLVACGDDDEDAESSDTSASEQTTTVADPDATDATDDPTPPTEPTDTTEDTMDDTEEPASDLLLGQPLPAELSLGWLGLTQADAEAKASDDGITLGVSTEGGEIVDGDVQVIIGATNGLVIYASVTDDAGVPVAEGAEVSDDLYYVGLTEDGAGTLADNEGTVWRVISIDGEGQAVTMDLQPDRLNFAIVDGIVVAVTRG